LATFFPKNNFYRQKLLEREGIKMMDTNGLDIVRDFVKAMQARGYATSQVRDAIEKVFNEEQSIIDALADHDDSDRHSIETFLGAYPQRQ
jgi:hypothetical protein